MKVLIAEDEEITREILVETVQKWDFETVAVENGKEALDALQAPDAPRIIILDWKMPVMDGLVALRNIRSRDSLKDTYVILLTSVSDQLNVQRAIGARANDYILKPYESEDLHSRLIKAKEHVESLQSE
jgi:CheY-like chemotaxis protein